MHSIPNFKSNLIACLFILSYLTTVAQTTSKWVYNNKENKLAYWHDSLGNSIPDFSAVGYHNGQKPFPKGKIIATLSPSGSDDTHALQYLIDSVSNLTTDNEPRVILLKAGNYNINSTININSNNIILRGEGDTEKGTLITFNATTQRVLFSIKGKGKMNKQVQEAQPITDKYVPVGAFSFHVKNVKQLHIGQPVLINRVANNEWIHAIGMDEIKDLREGGKNWSASGFDLSYERIVTAIDKKTGLITVNIPVMMALDDKYGENTLIPYSFKGRISECAIENILMKSTYTTDNDEQHGWEAISIEAAENCWIQQVTSLHFGQSCVSIHSSAKNITVDNCSCLDPISKIEGGRRYSFNCDGQLNLIKNCSARNGRHDYVTGARVCGPNVFTHCTATLTHADIGPHHRWATGTLYDCIVSDGAMNAQDRGNWGTGHGWSGAYQVFWNCTSATAAIQNPPMAYNWNIGFIGKNEGSKLVRPNGIWEATNLGGVLPHSLYQAQLEK